MAWGQFINGEWQYDLHPKQAALLNSTSRFKAAVAGTGGGKTACGPLWMMLLINQIIRTRDVIKEPIVLFVVAPTYAILSRATVPTMVKAFENTDLGGVYVQSRNRYYLPKGMGIIHLLSADNYQGLEGGQIDGAWIDEGGQIKYDAWVAILGRTGVKKAPILITTTPYWVNWLYHQFVKRWQGGDPDYHVEQWSSVDNPKYPRDEYERAKATMSPQRFAMRYDGSFVRLAGLVFPDLSTCKDDFKSLPAGMKFGGIDFGWTDPFAAIGGVLDKDNHVWFWYERYMREKTVEEHASKLPAGYQWFADSSRPDSIAHLRRLGINCKANRVMDMALGFDMINERIYQRTLHIHESLRALWAEGDEFRYPELDDDKFAPKPEGGFEHAIDGMRYGIANIDRRRVTKRAA